MIKAHSILDRFDFGERHFYAMIPEPLKHYAEVGEIYLDHLHNRFRIIAMEMPRACFVLPEEINYAYYLLEYLDGVPVEGDQLIQAMED